MTGLRSQSVPGAQRVMTGVGSAAGQESVTEVGPVAGDGFVVEPAPVAGQGPEARAGSVGANGLGSEPAVTLVPLRRRHLRGVLRIEAHNSHRPWSLGLFMAELRHAEARVYAAALVDNKVVGFAGELFAADDAHVTTIAVHPDWRRRAVGTRLMSLLARRAVARGATALTLEVAASNRSAQALYARFGLAPVGVRKNYYEDIKEDAVIMWAHDIDGPDYAARLDRVDASLPDPTVLQGWPT